MTQHLGTVKNSKNAHILTQDNDTLIDLVSGYGTTLLGHANKNIVTAMVELAQEPWLTPLLQDDRLLKAKTAFAKHLDSNYSNPIFFSTGMEACEFAMRAASQLTNRNEFIGFTKSNHGKSLFTTNLGWTSSVTLSTVHQVPFVDKLPEEIILHRISKLLRTEKIAGIFLEPIQGSNGGARASADFHHALKALCESFNTLLIADEILCGFYRAGSASTLKTDGVLPDITLFGKAIGNGFPVSACCMAPPFKVSEKMFPNSTFCNSSLACGIVAACLAEMSEINIHHLVSHIDSIFRSYISDFLALGITLTGAGALWFLHLPGDLSGNQLQKHLRQNKVLVTRTDSVIRLLPPATIPEDVLRYSLNRVLTSCSTMVANYA